jgi:hypothetical protein
MRGNSIAMGQRERQRCHLLKKVMGDKGTLKEASRVMCRRWTPCDRHPDG